MNKKNYILITLLMGCSVSMYAQRKDAVNERQLADTLNIGYQMNTSAQTGTYAISGVNAEAFENSSAIDITKSLYGKIAGLNVYQGAGASADNVSRLEVHGHEPLVLIDGYPRSFEDITSYEIESAYLLKDAAATALYGMRGANGVLLITTKRGKAAKLNVKAQYNFGVNTQFRAPEFADAYTYANSLNRALGNDGMAARYNAAELAAFRDGTNPYDYPNVDWWNKTMNKTGFSHNLKLSFNGGNEKFRYFTVIDYYRDRSMLKENINDDRYSTKPTDTRLSLRTNLDVNITESTYLKAGIMAKLQEMNGTVTGSNEIFNAIYKTPSAAFPVRYANGIYGGSSIYGENNPVALLKDKGHRRNMYTSLLADMSLRQDLDVLTEGLALELSVSFDNLGGMNETSSKQYRYMNSYPSLLDDGTLVTSPIIYGIDSKVLEHTQPFENLGMSTDFQAKASYNHAFGKHQVNAAVIYELQSTVLNGRNNTRKNMSVIANAGYAFDNRYVINAVINHSGSAYLPEGNKFVNYPAVSAAWIASNERFLKNVDGIDLLKIRASYGLSGWDGNLSHELWRYPYSGAPGYNFGSNAAGASGSAEGRLPVLGLTAEKSEKVTVGLDLAALSNRLTFTIDGFYEQRSNILVSGANTTSQIIGIEVGQVCEGINRYKGFDASINWNDKIGDFSYNIGGTMSYLNTEVVNDNQAAQQYDYLYHKGNKVGQMYGLEAIGFFNNYQEINNSPIQSFTQVRPGDVKYKDQNGDNVIDDRDVVKMFGSNIPRFYFGFDIQLAYKGFEISADFQGMTGVTTNLLNSPLYKPLVDNGNISKTFLDREIAWTAETKPTATMPRLTTVDNQNNYRNSSLWYRDASFLKLRSLVVAYTFHKTMTRFADIKVFLQGNNLFSADNIKFADPEQLQIAYPSVRSYWAGVKFNF